MKAGEPPTTNVMSSRSYETCCVLPGLVDYSERPYARRARAIHRGASPPQPLSARLASRRSQLLKKWVRLDVDKNRLMNFVDWQWSRVPTFNARNPLYGQTILFNSLIPRDQTGPVKPHPGSSRP